MKEKQKKDKIVKLRVSENLFDFLQHSAKTLQLSLNGYANFLLHQFIKKQAVMFDEKITNLEKKKIRVRVDLTPSEMDVLKMYALNNNWSVIKEVRYRLISSLAKKPKLTQEDLKAIYAVRSSINVLGANINRLVRDRELLSDNNIEICKELITLMTELRDKINYLEKCSSSNFKLKKTGDRDGC